jgi:hypothetical protein
MSSHSQGSRVLRRRESFQIMQLEERLRASQEELALVRETNARQHELSAAHIRALEEQLELQSSEGSALRKGKGKQRE